MWLFGSIYIYCYQVTVPVLQDTSALPIKDLLNCKRQVLMTLSTYIILYSVWKAGLFTINIQ